MMLVEDQKQGQIWVDVSGLNDELEQLHSPVEINVWLGGPVAEDHLTVRKAERIDVIK
ncbi:hypothetical protein QR695_06635 [Exiguobacterium mexicanum]|uniref:Uncharacterized protein n=2 Tax=Bacillales Family XII. Incertae Sedis TaxID=539742 RepID=A0ABT7MNB4_9BACL|nr:MULTISPECIES: hypothetical protein [Exiguobacterium]MDL5376681.1 hypothetical protein [Exiguobacterium mexicanum]